MKILWLLAILPLCVSPEEIYLFGKVYMQRSMREMKGFLEQSIKMSYRDIPEMMQATIH